MKNKDYPLYENEQVNSLKELINRSAKKYADKSAFSYERDNKAIKVSFRQFKMDVDSLGTFFLEQKYIKIKFAVIGENSYEWILSYFSVVNSGNIIVPLDRELQYGDLKNLIEDSGAIVLIYSDAFTNFADYMKNNNNSIKNYINMQDFPNFIKDGNSLINSGERTILDYEIDNKTLAVIMYTSGTTGVAKGVMLSHIGIAHGTVACLMNTKIVGSNILVLPLHHVFGSIAVVCTMLQNGSEVLINSGLPKFLSDMEKFKPDNLFLVPLFIETFYKRIWDGAAKQGKEGLLKKLIKISNALLKIGIDARRLLFKSVLKAFGGNLKLILSGGAPIDAKYMQGLRDFGVNILNGYGLTECSGVISVTRNNYYRDGSVGLVLPCCEVKIADPDENGHGEIYVKGNNVMLGYHNSEQATKEAFDGDWFKTGDLGYMDEDGFLYVSGRKKNLIVLSNGRNVYPEEIEFALLKHIYYIKETVVYAKDNKIVAEVFLDIENHPDCVSIIDNDVIELNRLLPPYMNIGKAEIRDTEFPKTTTKKIKRRYDEQGI